MTAQSEQTDKLSRIVTAFQEAMRAERIPVASIEHVVNRVLYGDPHPGTRCRLDELGQQVNVHVTVTANPRPPRFDAFAREIARHRMNLR